MIFFYPFMTTKKVRKDLIKNFIMISCVRIHSMLFFTRGSEFILEISEQPFNPKHVIFLSKLHLSTTNAKNVNLDYRSKL